MRKRGLKTTPWSGVGRRHGAAVATARRTREGRFYGLWRAFGQVAASPPSSHGGTARGVLTGAIGGSGFSGSPWGGSTGWQSGGYEVRNGVQRVADEDAKPPFPHSRVRTTIGDLFRPLHCPALCSSCRHREKGPKLNDSSAANAAGPCPADAKISEQSGDSLFPIATTIHIFPSHDYQ